MRESKTFIILLCLSLATAKAQNDNDSSEDPCRVCANDTNCTITGEYSEVSCECNRGFFGDPFEKCHKFDEDSPCDPNPCGSNSKCVENDEKLGTYCDCLPGHGVYPPKCRQECQTGSECKANEYCEPSGFCSELNELEICGANAVMRLDEGKTKVHCTCRDGFYPEAKIGCRELKADDPEIPLELIAAKLRRVCDTNCGKNAYCDEASHTCRCSQGFTGDPLKRCDFIDDSNESDPCKPNVCGPYSICKPFNETYAKCSCVKGFGKGPGCFSCRATVFCPLGQLCAHGRCIENVCEAHCGLNADCNVHAGRLECSCGVLFEKRPYVVCDHKVQTRLKLTTAHALASW